MTEQDGYYIVSAICIGSGVLAVLFFLIPTAKKLQGMCRHTLRPDATAYTCSQLSQ